MSRRLHVLGPDVPPERLDRVLSGAFPDLSRSRLQALIRSGEVTVDGAPVLDPARRVAGPIAIAVVEPTPVGALPRAEPIPLSIAYEDDALVVIDKPAGLVVHPGAGNPDGTLVNALLHHCGSSLSGIGGVVRPGIVHRLDKGTSGLIVAAKTDAAHRALAAQFADHGRTGVLERAYSAFAWGTPVPGIGTVDLALARSTAARERMAVTSAERGRRAVTHFALLESYAGGVATLLRCRLETGRTHQIRVHLAHLRHPLLGDDTYGAGFRTRAARLTPEAREAVSALGRPALHAGLLQFAHPRDGRVMRFESPLPDDLAQLRAALAKGAPSHPDP